MFAACAADIAIFGGSAGPGKSWSLVAEPVKWCDLAGFTGIIFRNERKQLTGGGSVWEESEKLYPLRGGRARRGNTLDWRFPSGATVEFGYLDSLADAHSHKSKQYTYIGLDEATDIPEDAFWYMVSRNRSMCGVKPYLRAATNPDPDSHIRKLIDWWIGEDGFPIKERSGVLRWFVRIEDKLHWADSPEELRERFAHKPPEDVMPQSLTFIPALLSDNPILTSKDPDYRAKLLAMHEHDRMALLEGNWDVRPKAGDYFPQERAQIIDSPPAMIETIRAWDKAGTKPTPTTPNPDWTVGLKMGRDAHGSIYILDVVRERLDPLDTERLMVSTARRDGTTCKIGLWQDPAQAGKFDVAHFTRLFMGWVVETERASKDKVTYAKPFSSQWLARNVYIVRGPWNDAFIAEAHNFPPKTSSGKDDQIDAASLAHLKLSEISSELALLEALTTM